jgi:hypothetical protein
VLEKGSELSGVTYKNVKVGNKFGIRKWGEGINKWFRSSRVPGFKGSRVQRFKGSKVEGFAKHTV